MKHQWVRSTLLILCVSAALLPLSMGATSERQLTEKALRAFTLGEMRSLAGGAPCPQWTCSVYTYTNAVSQCSNSFGKFYVSDCLTTDGLTCNLVESENNVNFMYYLEGARYGGRRYTYCVTQNSCDGCTGGTYTGSYYGTLICE